jgi:cytochrome c-type biogenesis protein
MKAKSLKPNFKRKFPNSNNYGFHSNFAENKEFPVLAAFALGLLTAIAPCPLATNITATAFIAKTINNKKKVVLSGLLYTLGKNVFIYFIGALIYFGASKFQVAKLFQ